MQCILHRLVNMYCRLSETESLINSHIYVPMCSVSGNGSALVLPGLCNCGDDNSCNRLERGRPKSALLYDTESTFACANDTDG